MEYSYRFTLEMMAMMPNNNGNEVMVIDEKWKWMNEPRANLSIHHGKNHDQSGYVTRNSCDSRKGTVRKYKWLSCPNESFSEVKQMILLLRRIVGLVFGAAVIEITCSLSLRVEQSWNLHLRKCVWVWSAYLDVDVAISTLHFVPCTVCCKGVRSIPVYIWQDATISLDSLSLEVFNSSISQYNAYPCSSVTTTAVCWNNSQRYSCIKKCSKGGQVGSWSLPAFIKKTT